MIDQTPTTHLKVKSPIKLLALVASVIALSWFFEGYRQVSQSASFAHIAVLILAVVSTAFLLWLQAFWIYIEEKSKGTLHKQIVHFDRLQKYLEGKPSTIASPKEGDCSHCD